jgi:hypothetical protein
MKLFSSIIFILIISSSCTYNKTEIIPYSICNETRVTYINNIAPLIQSKCSTGLGPGTGCHDSWILDYNGVRSIVKNGKLMSTVLNKTMPKIPNNYGITSLTDEEIQLITCWVEYDAPEY